MWVGTRSYVPVGTTVPWEEIRGPTKPAGDGVKQREMYPSIVAALPTLGTYHVVLGLLGMAKVLVASSQGRRMQYACKGGGGHSDHSSFISRIGEGE